MSLSPTEKLRIFSRMFTRPAFASLASTGDWKRALSFLISHKLIRAASLQPLSSLYESAWSEMKSSYRNEYVYKTEISNRLVFGRHSPRTAALHIELPIGRSIVDVAVFNGTSTAYEVKTEFDSARRLQTQTDDYSKAFDRVYVVAHHEFAEKYASLVTREVGVLALSKGGSLSIIKEASSNVARLDRQTMFMCLRRTEYVPILELAFKISIDLPNGLISKRCRDLFCKLDPPEASQYFVNAMRARKIDLQTRNFVSTLPQSLRVLGYATPLSERQRSTMITVLNSKVPMQLA